MGFYREETSGVPSWVTTTTINGFPCRASEQQTHPEAAQASTRPDGGTPTEAESRLRLKDLGVRIQWIKFYRSDGGRGQIWMNGAFNFVSTNHVAGKGSVNTWYTEWIPTGINKISGTTTSMIGLNVNLRHWRGLISKATRQPPTVVHSHLLVSDTGTVQFAPWCSAIA